MARPERTARATQRTRNLALLRRRIIKNQATITTIVAIPKATRTAAQRKSLADAREENAVYELILDLGGHIDTTDLSPDVAE